ncbi:YacC family pilotin-like protein [Xenorhabdus szentirmaii]|uniref:YacC n=2 Tax=Xenorhabdus szentirmaii TaxID=290112 RepID=W1IW96_9GAMM|nr:MULTISPECIES: YacC family pilotin-like protein [Xenorhabdus]MBD2781892.1 YacC family pilotin-like protein [Xenorhabdus sp. 38]MBD2792125.1 YacC family pilotin-like protein [Xenorhabdus sp. CUL]MBD2801988.1 YacC family pilotin-like protein [Xenorhabdus sp. M]MBD2803242.1 YacC family pilotin-like protein [Xenorhabdus sp. ZM]MBD2821907.1 YacC family pilotin-like protein [Xenorhabdus sp. 42]
MQKIVLLTYILLLLGLSQPAKALSENEAEDLADLTAVYIFLKYDCGYTQIPDREIRRTIIYFAQRNKWDLNNYDSQLMEELNQLGYNDLKGINLPHEVKCRSLARRSLSLLAYVK